MSNTKKTQNRQRQYPEFYEKVVPIAIGALVLVIIILLIFTIAVGLGMFSGA
jgi:hypothetical protein